MTAQRLLAELTSVVDEVAEALWQEESHRAGGRPRGVPWSECAEADKQKWRGLARAAIEVVDRRTIKHAREAMLSDATILRIFGHEP